MTNAYNAVKYQGMSLRGAATAFNVPESTLRDRVHGRVSLECSRPGPPTFFTFEEEKKMVDHILFMSKIGYPYTRNQVGLICHMCRLVLSTFDNKKSHAHLRQ